MRDPVVRPHRVREPQKGFRPRTRGFLLERRAPVLVNVNGSGPTLMRDQLGQADRVRFDAQMAAWTAACDLAREADLIRFRPSIRYSEGTGRPTHGELSPAVIHTWENARDEWLFQTGKWKEEVKRRARRMAG